MKPTTGTAIEIDLSLSLTDGTTLDQVKGLRLVVGQEPPAVLPAIEDTLCALDLVPGLEVEIHLPASEAFGPPSTSPRVTLPRAQLPKGAPEPRVGMDVQILSTEGEQQLWWMVEVHPSHLVLSRDHPLAGQDLRADVLVRSVRAA